MEIGLVRRVDIDQEMQQSYLDYAMSVIVARALPDARDGLKPVQRRILYAMHDMNVDATSPYKKSARIVGEVLGKYHPHGDSAVYEAMARLAQDFSMRQMLVDGQGNFGSIDGDPPAAMRYTEARLTRFAVEILGQIDRDTVDFSDNFDGTLREPLVLPAAVPNLLVNGASGIAVGMATSIPPHNLGEVISALSYMLEEWEHLDDINVSDLMRFIKGPDFPTGGIILQEGPESGLLSAYGSGRGRITVRGRVHTEDTGRGRGRLIITELPYQVNKTTLIERIAELVREGHLDGISDLRDESDRHGMRVVIELSKSGDQENVLRALYHRTPLQTTFGITLLALVDGEPRLLTLKQALRVFLEHRLEVVRRRSEYDLSKARARAHILEGLRVALKNLDEVINLIRQAPDVETARQRLIKRFKLSEIQAQSILDMQLRRLASLERKKIEDEYKELQAQIKDLESLLKSPKRMRTIVEEELGAMKATYDDRRRTQIFSIKEGDSSASLLTTTDMTPAETVWVGVTIDGLIGRTVGDELPRIAGRDAPLRLLRTNTHETLYLVNRQGQASAVTVHTLPEVQSFAEGVRLNKASALSEDDYLAAMFTVPAANSEGFILTATRQGMLKKSAVSELPGPSSQTFTLAKVNADDALLDVLVTDGKAEIGLFTAQGMGIRFSEDEVRPMGLVAAGVMGVKLGNVDSVAALVRWDAKADVMWVASDGKAWRTSAAEFPLQGRYGQGVIACKPPLGVQVVAAMIGKASEGGLLHLEKLAARNVKIGDVPASKRGAKGTELVPVKGGDSVVGFTPVPVFKTARSTEDKAPRVKEAVAQVALPGLESDAKPVRGAAATKSKAGPAAPEAATPTRAKKMAVPAAAEKPVRKAKSAAAALAAPARSSRAKPAAAAPAEVEPTRAKKTASAAAPAPRTRKAATTEVLPEVKKTSAAKKPAQTSTQAKATGTTRAKPAAAQQAKTAPAAAKAATKKPAASSAKTTPEVKPAAKKPVAGGRATTSAAKKPAGGASAAKKPATSTPAAKKPANSTPAAKKPVVKPKK
ncbi:MAG: DNA gyrase subunit A [Anaerolineaceae bacterium]|nr:DNA gyrase subunit A [Anaerolineaceae bacterium]